jgi:hypothetical protein
MVSSCRREEAVETGFVSVWVTIGDPSPASGTALVERPTGR